MQVKAVPDAATQTTAVHRKVLPMSKASQSRPSFFSAELALVILVPVLALLAGAAMIHVASHFGFTALGEPVQVSENTKPISVGS